MASWDLNQTHALVRRIFGRTQEALTQASTRSVNDRKAFSSYHFTEAMRLSKEFEKKHLGEVATTLEIHVAGAERKHVAFERYMVKAGAHSIAAVQSLHAIPDIFAHAVYFATGQNLGPKALAESEISLPRVVSCLKQNRQVPTLSSQLALLQSGEAWSHLAAVANMSKHRSVVRATYSEDWTGTRARVRELHITAFERQGKKYAAKSLRDLLEPEHDRILMSIVRMGHELDNCLRKVMSPVGNCN
jgi:hypothetical protein